MSLTFVTGAAGAIGNHVVRQLQAGGTQVVGLGHGLLPDGAALPGWINGDVSAENLDILVERHGRPERIFHLAGGASVASSLAAPLRDFHRTVGATASLLEWMHRNAPEAALVMASSAAVYGDAAQMPITESAARAPLSPYGVHKSMMEMVAGSWARNFGLRVAAVRLFSVYGPGLRKQLVWEVLNRLKRGERRLALGGTGTETRDWVHITDAARLLIEASRLASPQAPCLNGCTGMAVSVKETVDALAQGFGTQVELRFDGQRRAGDPLHLVGRPCADLAISIAPREGLAAFAAEFARS